MTKARGMERYRLRVQLGTHIHIPRNVGKCEGMSPCTPKWAPILGVGVLMESRIFRKWFEGSKLIGLKNSLYHWKILKTKMSKMGSHDPFEYLQHKLWPKKGLGIKVSIWFLTIKS
jgi:hypothetical protein